VTTVGLILAAGAGRRMGGPKALLRPDPEGPTLLESTIGRLRAAGLDRVVVVVGAAAAEASPLAEGLGAEVATATDWAEGMGASLRAGLAHLARTGAGQADPTPDPEDRVDAALVTLVDLPDVGAAVHRRVLEAVHGPPAAALVRATYRGRPGHPVLLGRDHWGAVTTSARGDRGARDHLAHHRTTTVECSDLASGRDLDTVADLDDAGDPDRR
jgi:CTP:molybdopterin cytidylyltransferase MocA